MKKIIIIALLLAGFFAGYLSYDWWQFNKKSQNVTPIKSIYSWQDKNGGYHFSDTKPENINNFNISDGYQYAPIPLVYRIKHIASPITDKIIKMISGNNSDNKKSIAGYVTSSNKKTVKIFTTVRCGYCISAKKYFDQKGIRYTEYDIEKSASAKAEFTNLKGRGVPLIVINGNKIFGFNKKEIDMHLR